jgi:hypothetical protein
MQGIMFLFMLLGGVVGVIPTAILGFCGLIKFGDGTGNESGLAEFVMKSCWVGWGIIVVAVIAILVAILVRGVPT